jgi:hypothetical protein
MKIRPLQRHNVDDYRQAPQWFRDFLDVTNQGVDTLNTVLQGNIDINNNLAAESQTVTLSHNTPTKVRLLRLQSVPSFCIAGYAGGNVGVGRITNYQSDGSLMVTVYFLGTPPTGSVATKLWFMA